MGQECSCNCWLTHEPEQFYCKLLYAGLRICQLVLEFFEPLAKNELMILFYWYFGEFDSHQGSTGSYYKPVYLTLLSIRQKKYTGSFNTI